VLGAKRAGIKEVLLPADKRPNVVADLPADILGRHEDHLRAHAGRSARACAAEGADCAARRAATGAEAEAP